ncbi:MAG TPA: aldose epimerase family protein [Streptosporangiaceae bacterium]|jgi:aldose 1-epimerase|nr:aldose epimerase family protein [Streptosporangiaceae bacterium]
MRIASARWLSVPATRIAAVAIVGAATVGVLGAANAPAQTAKTHSASACTGPTITKQAFGKAMDIYYHKRLAVFRYTLTNCQGMSVSILSYGGIIQQINVPGRDGQSADVVLGFSTLKDYITHDSPPVTVNGGPYFGETIGRYGNRIAKGTFHLDGHTYTLPINNGVNDLHGGLVGFGNHVWAATEVHSTGTVGVRMKLVSPNGDDGANVGCSCTGFPGQLTVHVTFTLNDANQLMIHYTATTNADTVINLTNHSYFNLAGESSGSVYGQKVDINADSYTPTDATQIPTGQIIPVKGTPFNFTTPQTIGSRINVDNKQLLIAQGYDHNWVLNKTGPQVDGLTLAAQASDPASGRGLSVYTDQPGVQFYSGNFLTGTLVGISGHIYRQSDGYTFETQHFPNSPNQPNFPTTELKPGQMYNTSTIFQFSS